MVFREDKMAAVLNKLKSAIMLLKTPINHMFQYKPFVYQDGETMEGIAAEYLYLLAEAYNFSIVFVENEAGLYGSVDENDTWNGLIAMMLQGDIDMTGTALSITEARQRAVEFTAPFFMDSPALGVGAQDLGIFHFLRPFTLEVWLYYISSVVVTIIFVLWLSCIQRHLTGNGVTKHGTSSIADTVTYTVGTAVNQSSGLHLRTWSIRVVSLLSWLMFSLLSMSYSGHLVASLTTTQVYIPFNNLEEMVAQDEYKLVFEHGTLYHDMFRDATDPVFREGWAKAEKDIKLEGDYVEHVITSGKYVIINDRVDLVFRSRQRPQCDFFVLPDNLGPIGSGFALPSGSPFKDMFSNVILDAQAGGLDHSWFKKYWPDDWCSAKLKISAQAQAVGLHSLLGLFLLVIGGVAIASLTFIIEYFTVKPRRKL